MGAAYPLICRKCKARLPLGTMAAHYAVCTVPLPPRNKYKPRVRPKVKVVRLKDGLEHWLTGAEAQHRVGSVQGGRTSHTGGKRNAAGRASFARALEARVRRGEVELRAPLREKYSAPGHPAQYHPETKGWTVPEADGTRRPISELWALRRCGHLTHLKQFRHRRPLVTLLEPKKDTPS